MGRDAKALSLWDTLRFQLYLSIPAFLLGVVIPNRWFLTRYARWGAAHLSNRFLRKLRAKYRSNLLWLWFPTRRTLLVLAPATIDAVLASSDNAPDPELKKRAISRFAPGALVMSADGAQGGRRAFNTSALDLGRLHRDADTFVRIAASEARRVFDHRTDTLRWGDFEALGKRISHQIILGEGRIDDGLAADLARMLRRANLLLRDEASFAAFHARIAAALGPHASAATAPCLLGTAARALVDGSASESTCVTSQIAFWFFVLKDAVELHVPRTLALIAAHPEVQAKVRSEIREAGELTAQAIDRLRYLEACIVEQLRLWTPVPLLLRRAVTRCIVGSATVEAEQQLLVHAGFYHRDRLVFGRVAHTFAPDEVDAGAMPPLYVFSAHERSCAGQSLVRFVLKSTLASMLARFHFELVRPVIEPGRIPYLVDQFGIELSPVRDALAAAERA
ncbi:MAG TPA: cytochrome P450 [Casimicrobiaceae bacterium]|nr:cytochrome P450 [Casimicrobiaceae bacterium]